MYYVEHFTSLKLNDVNFIFFLLLEAWNQFKKVDCINEKSITFTEQINIFDLTK